MIPASPHTVYNMWAAGRRGGGGFTIWATRGAATFASTSGLSLYVRTMISAAASPDGLEHARGLKLKGNPEWRECGARAGNTPPTSEAAQSHPVWLWHKRLSNTVVVAQETFQHSGCGTRDFPTQW